MIIENSEVALPSPAQKAALRRGALRTENVRMKVKKAMLLMESEIKENDGIYPHCNGVISFAEVARRATIHPTTFYTKNLQDLGQLVRDWIFDQKGISVAVEGKVKKSLGTRAAEWRNLYERLLQSHRISELELQDAQYQLREAQSQIEVLLVEKKCLNDMLGKMPKSNIIPLKKNNER